MDITAEIKKFFKGEVLNDEETLANYSHDASLFELKPQVVVFPKNVDDIKQLVKFVSENKSAESNLSLTARSGGTDMTGGPLNESIIIDFTKHLNHFKNIKNQYAITEPGVFYRDFEKETLKHNLFLPSYPASREICAIGGMVANNSGGEKTLAYGKTQNYVKELKVILRDGREYLFKKLNKDTLEEKFKLQTLEGDIYRRVYALVNDNQEIIQKAKPQVSKNSAGYYLWDIWDGQSFDLTKLITGSQGTLGIVTEVKFSLIPTKKHSSLLVIFMKDLKSLADVINTVLPFKPESFESYDDHTLKLAMRFLPDLIKVLKPKNIFSLAFQFLPELKMLLSGGLPKLVLLVEFAGDNKEEVHKQLIAVEDKLKTFHLKTHVTKTPEEAEKYWVIRRESFNLLRRHVRGKQTAPFIDDLIVRPEKLPEFLPALNKILDSYDDFTYTIAGHVGDGNFHIIPLMNLADENQRAMIPKIADEV
ncbi:MAG: FAD-binding oxidoreductase, partial [Bacteroidetes bacterium]|nr:FAD-binding oxidoreductase [Bacteroidota bacterium]